MAYKLKRTVTLDVEAFTPTVVWWHMEEITQEYVGAKKTITCMDLFETGEEFFVKVIGRLPDELCPEPHRVLQDYVKYEVTRDVDMPVYVTLAERQSGWPDGQRN